MKKMSKLKSEKLFTIRAYCADCKKLLLESNPMTRKELMASWDRAVFDAPGIPCKDCGNQVPNFSIDLKIYNKGSKLEYKPESIMPKPKMTLEEMLRPQN